MREDHPNHLVQSCASPHAPAAIPNLPGLTVLLPFPRTSGWMGGENGAKGWEKNTPTFLLAKVSVERDWFLCTRYYGMGKFWRKKLNSYTVLCSKVWDDVLNWCENFTVFFIFWGLSHQRMLGNNNVLKWKQQTRFLVFKQILMSTHHLLSLW